MKLRIRDLHKSFGNLNVLDGVNLELESGRIYCLMGPSGSGKTTLMRVILGLETADSGDILWADAAGPGMKAESSGGMAATPATPKTGLGAGSESSGGTAAAAATPKTGSATGAEPSGGMAATPSTPRTGSVSRPRFSAVFQEDRLCETFTPVENVMMVTGKAYSREQIRRELSRLLPEESVDRPVSTLSGGMKRRTAICRALLAPYDVLLMDEPFTGLDEDTRQTVISYIREKTAGRLVLISTHQEEDIHLLGADLIVLAPISLSAS